MTDRKVKVASLMRYVDGETDEAKRLGRRINHINTMMKAVVALGAMMFSLIYWLVQIANESEFMLASMIALGSFVVQVVSAAFAVKTTKKGFYRSSAKFIQSFAWFCSLVITTVASVLVFFVPLVIVVSIVTTANHNLQIYGQIGNVTSTVVVPTMMAIATGIGSVYILMTTWTVVAFVIMRRWKSKTNPNQESQPEHLSQDQDTQPTE